MPEEIEIPAEWQQLHWRKQVALAQELSGKDDAFEAGQARAIIDAEARRRAADPVRNAPPRDERPEDPNRKVPLRLLRDSWEGEERVRADGTITMWTLETAKHLIKNGVAERADPLPGE